jgi:hypothetical protein
MTKTRDTSRVQNDDYIEGPKMSEGPAAAPALPIDIILPHLELFCSPGNAANSDKGNGIFDDSNYDGIRLHK